MNIIIIEDEPLMAEELANEISRVDDTINIIATFGSVAETKEYLAENDLPDLFFSDIQLSDGFSFEIFSSIEKPVPVIFCTAYDEYGLEAFKANGIDYLLKPFDNTSIQKTIKKYKSLTGGELSHQDLSKAIEYIKEKDSISKKSLIVHQGQKIYPIRYSDIRMLFLKDGITYIITDKVKKYIINSSLDKIESMLDSNFYRVNRQIIIHRNAIGHINTYFARKLLITTVFPTEIDVIVSKANASNFLQWLEAR